MIRGKEEQQGNAAPTGAGTEVRAGIQGSIQETPKGSETSIKSSTLSRKPGRPPGKKNGARRSLTPEQWQAFQHELKVSTLYDLLYQLALYFGMRVGEVAGLRLSDLNLQSSPGQLKIAALKGGDVRWYDLPEPLQKKLKKWLRERRQSDWLFPSERNPGRPIPRITVQLAFKRLAEKAGLPKDLSVHSLRHSQAVWQVEQGFSPVMVQRWLRQKDIRSAMQYFVDVEVRQHGHKVDEMMRDRIK